MSELSTERLEKFVSDIKTDGMCDITDHQVESALIRLLAYEQAAKNPVAWGLFDASNGALYNYASSQRAAEQYRDHVHQSDDSLTVTIKPLYTEPQPAPVLPKQPESIVCYALMHTQTCDVYNTHSSLENAEMYLKLIHQSDDSLTLRVAPLCVATTSQPAMPDNDDSDLIQRLSGRAQFLRDRGEVKTPELIEAAISALSAQLVRLAYKLPDVLDYDCEFEEGDYDIDEEPWLRGRVDGFNEALQIIKRSLNTKQKPTAQESE